MAGLADFAISLSGPTITVLPGMSDWRRVSFTIVKETLTENIILYTPL